MKNHVNAAAVEQILHVSAPTVCSRWTSTAERERLVSLSLMVVHAAGVVPAVGCCPRSSGRCMWLHVRGSSKRREQILVDSARDQRELLGPVQSALGADSE